MTSEERIQAIREETERIYKRIAKMNKKSDMRIAKLREESEERQKQSDERIAKLRAESEEMRKQSDERIAKSQEETDARIAKIRKKTRKITQEARELRKENDRHIAELAVQIKEQITLAKEQTKKMKEQTKKMKEQTRQIKEQGRQIGGYGNKFGALTEALAQPSLRRILKEHFKASYEDSYSRRSKERGDVEIDAWGWARNGTAAAYLIEVKSRFRPEHLQQVWRHVEMFRSLEPKFRHSPVYPILAVVEIEKEHRELIWNSGVYLIDVADGVFELAEPPAEFKPVGSYGAEETGGGVQRAAPSHLRLVPNVARAEQN